MVLRGLRAVGASDYGLACGLGLRVWGIGWESCVLGLPLIAWRLGFHDIFLRFCVWVLCSKGLGFWFLFGYLESTMREQHPSEAARSSRTLKSIRYPYRKLYGTQITTSQSSLE